MVGSVGVYQHLCDMGNYVFSYFIWLERVSAIHTFRIKIPGGRNSDDRVSSFKRRKSKRSDQLEKNAITGILILTGGTGLVAWGEQYVTASEAAISIATGPFWFIAIDRKTGNIIFQINLFRSGWSLDLQA